jgi:sulfhydrogenase subunit gamma (sulfur reductase)
MTLLLHDKLEKQSIYLPTVARIAAIRDLTAMEKLYTIQLPDGYSLNNRPGQFVEVAVFGVGEAPISISSSPSRSNGSFELCIRRVGDLTNVLHQKKVGDTIGIRGPFGRGFPIERFRGKDILFAPGGMGLPPLRSLINEILDDRGNYGRITILYGARTPGDLLFKDELAEWDARDDVDLRLTVDHGDDTWKGNVGVITTLFPDLQVYARNTIAVVIGPPVMYRYVLMELLGKGIPEGNIWFSLERRMKCGVGKCGHCQMENIYSCQSGPAFPYSEIKHIEEAI